MFLSKLLVTASIFMNAEKYNAAKIVLRDGGGCIYQICKQMKSSTEKWLSASVQSFFMEVTHQRCFSRTILSNSQHQHNNKPINIINLPHLLCDQIMGREVFSALWTWGKLHVWKKKRLSQTGEVCSVILASILPENSKADNVSIFVCVSQERVGCGRHDSPPLVVHVQFDSYLPARCVSGPPPPGGGGPDLWTRSSDKQMKLHTLRWGISTATTTLNFSY